MNRYLGITLFLFTLMAVSCIREDADDNHCPDTINLVYDWSHGESLRTNDSLIIIAPDGTKTYLKTNNVGTTLKLHPGLYTLIAYEPTPGIKIDGSNLSIGTDQNGYAAEPAPFSSGITTFIVTDGGAKKLVLPMYYQTRDLIIKVNVIGLGVETLNSITGWLDGITVSRSLTEGFTPFDGNPRHAAIIGGKALYGFSPTSISTIITQQFSGEKRLLGVDAAVNQILHLTLHFAGGDREISPDVTQALYYFHTDGVDEPFVIELTIEVTEDFSADIIDWISGPQSEMDAH